MDKLVKPRWIFIINTIPLIILFLILNNDYQVIKTLLSPGDLLMWRTFIPVLGIYGVLNFLYALILQIKKKEIQTLYAVLNLISSIAIIFYYIYNQENIFPWTIPQWMIPGERLIYTGTFIMPTIAYLIFILVFKLTSLNRKFNGLISFGITIAIPVLWYIFFTIGIPSWLSFSSDFGELFLIMLLIAGTVFFLFFLIRTLYIFIQKNSHRLAKYQLLWKITFSLLLPFSGLYLNNSNSILFHMFGDFSDPYFYILTIVNGIFICLPSMGNRVYRMLLFIGRSISYPFSFYFFLVFIPFLPLSILAVIAVGLGFLMLAPLFLFMVHTQELVMDWKYLNSQLKKRWMITMLSVSLLIIPGVLCGSFYRDKQTLYKTLDYLYSPDYSKTYTIDRKSLKKTMDTVVTLRDSRIDFFDFNDNYIP